MIPMDFFKDEIYEWIPKLVSVDLLLVVEIFFKKSVWKCGNQPCDARDIFKL